MTKLFNDTVSEVNACIQCLLADLTPSLLQCDHLLYAAAATVDDLLHQPQPSGKHSRGSWKLRLEMTIWDLRRDLSRLVVGGFPPCGSRKLLYRLSGLHCKYGITSLYSFQVAMEIRWL